MRSTSPAKPPAEPASCCSPPRSGSATRPTTDPAAKADELDGHELLRRRLGPDDHHLARHVRIPPTVDLRRRTHQPVRQRGRRPPTPDAAQGPDHRPALQPRRSHRHRRTTPPALHHQPHRTSPLRAAEPRPPWSRSPKPTATAPTSPTGPASTRAALDLGEEFSQHLPISDPDACNELPRAYRGPVVAVVDANTFSCGDLFAAGIVDHDIGQIVSVGDATGAGGANVWTSDDIQYAYHAAGRPLATHPARNQLLRSQSAE